MGKEQPSSYYDKIYSNSPEYSKDWRNSRYLRVWERMCQRFDKKVQIIDLGCGVGQTASFMIDKGFDKYFGLDFSEEAIKRAKAYHLVQPNYDFFCMDIIKYFTTFCIPELWNGSQFLLSEVLEHIENDEAILIVLSEKFPDSRISLSVPSFDDPSHVRCFKSTISVRERYSPFIKIEDLSQIGPWFVVQGRLK